MLFLPVLCAVAVVAMIVVALAGGGDSSNHAVKERLAQRSRDRADPENRSDDDYGDHADHTDREAGDPATSTSAR